MINQLIRLRPFDAIEHDAKSILSFETCSEILDLHFKFFRVVRKTNTKTETGFLPRIEVKYKRKINDIIAAVSCCFQTFSDKFLRH